MKRLIYSALIAVCFISTANIFAGTDLNFEPRLKFNSKRDYSKEIKERDYEIASNYHKKIAGSLIGASIDFQLGYGSTSATADPNVNNKSVGTTSKSGIILGALLNVNLFNILNFSTGLDFTKKNFGITIPYVNPLQTGDSIVQDLSNNYINIPMNVNFSGMLTDKVGVSFSGGPYLGFLLNAENAISGFKNFDFGLNGILTGKYYLNPFVSVILGTKGQYGGLNNLINTNSVKKLHTFNWGAFTGLSVGF